MTPRLTPSTAGAIALTASTAGLQRTPLVHGWTVTALEPSATAVPPTIAQQTYPAHIPGCVHTDLLAARAIPDPYLDHNDLQVAWIGNTAWRYACTFDLTDEQLGQPRTDLVCDGLDTVSTIRVNGQTVGRSENMHVGYRFDVTEALRRGTNQIAIDFEAPLPFARAMEATHGTMPYVGNGSNPPLPHNMMRKMACNFGWDWGPALVTAGIWRPIHLESWRGARLKPVRPWITRADAELATVEVQIDLETQGPAAPRKAIVTLHDPAGRNVARAEVTLPASEHHRAVPLHIDRPQRWWPIGYGEQPRYTLNVELLDAQTGETLDHASRRIGLRTSRLVTTPDTHAHPLGQGSTFHLEVNGRRVYCKGANWIPDDCFPSRITPQRYRAQVQTARDANMNMLRVWGGGIYEDHAFYDACDELGIMVWQDFAMACACYHEHEPYASWIRDEARYNVARLSAHPSLVLWNGCNENVLGVHAWGADWRALRAQGLPWGLKYYLSTFPEALAELDPTKPYWPASPYSGTPDLNPNANEHGNCHIWDVWNGAGDARNYLSHYPRFASEFGFHGPPTYATLDRAIPADQRQHDSPAMVHHNRHAGGQPLAHERMADYFIPPDNFDDWLYLAQVVQARSLALGVEWFRALSPWNSGALYWQFNDCWPVASWSAVDGDQRRKPLWFATRRFLADRLVTIRPTAPIPPGQPFGPLSVYLHNDTDVPWSGELHAASHRFQGDNGRSLLTRPIDVPARGLLKIDLTPDLKLPPDTFLTASVGTERAFWWPHPDRNIPYPQAELDVDVHRVTGGYRLVLIARTLVRDLCIFADRLDPQSRVSDQLITLLPGERATLTVESDKPLSPRALTTRPVLQCVNAFGL